MSSLPEPDPFFRSHFEHVNRLADRSYEQVWPAYQLGQNAALADDDAGQFEEIEKDLENGWLNVRVGHGDWASVREFVRAGFDYTRQGRILNAPPPGGSPSRPPYADPLGDAIDPTIPDHPERL
jgi:hypothetical protein